MGNKNILLGLTTTRRSDWRGKVNEIIKYGIKEISLFPTALPKKEREELYSLLKRIPALKIPHAHLRGDMSINEIDYLAKNFQTKLFNIHPKKSKYSHPEYIKKYADMVYIENVDIVPEEEELMQYAGLCLDFSHWEDYKLQKNEDYINKLERLLPLYKIGCCHISGIVEKPHSNEDRSNQGTKVYSTHLMKNLKEVDYIKKYKKYLHEYISIELENDFIEQLKVKKYLEKLINF